MITVRQAKEIDVKSIHAFVNQLAEHELDFKSFNEIFLKNINNPDNLYLVACDENDQCVGFTSCHGQMLLHHVGFVAEIQEMFVDSKFRNMQIGSLLINNLKPWLEARHCVSLEVTPNNRRHRAHDFYLDNGFGQTHLKFTQSFEQYEKRNTSIAMLWSCFDFNCKK